MRSRVRVCFFNRDAAVPNQGPLVKVTRGAGYGLQGAGPCDVCTVFALCSHECPRSRGAPSSWPAEEPLNPWLPLFACGPTGFPCQTVHVWEWVGRTDVDEEPPLGVSWSVWGPARSHLLAHPGRRPSAHLRGTPCPGSGEGVTSHRLSLPWSTGPFPSFGASPSICRLSLTHLSLCFWGKGK